jgi:plasmid stabilization system protein ParE
MSIPVRYTTHAADLVLELELWWRANVQSDPNRISEELQAALELLQQHPLAGKRHNNRQIQGARKLLLTGIQYYLYYTYDPNGPLIEVCSIWNTKRRRPKLTP